jgi:hypothetical protein
MRFSDGLAQFNRLAFNRVMRTFAGRRGSPVAVVEHRGRRSGRQYRTPVLAFGAAGGCTLKRGGRRVELTAPRLLDAAAGRTLLPPPMRPALRLLRVRRVLRLSAA